LKEISRLCEEGKLKSTARQTFELSARNLRKTHEILESGKAIGKISLTVGDDIQE
jgi:NADPH2:quinone reductase